MNQRVTHDPDFDQHEAAIRFCEASLSYGVMQWHLGFRYGTRGRLVQPVPYEVTLKRRQTEGVLEVEARVGIEGRPPSALLLRAQFQPDNTGF